MTGDSLTTVNVKFVQEVTDARILNLIQHFENKFREKADYFVRVPGRVNLIGEHIDYCGYAVLPMALSQDIIVACKTTNDNNIYLSNVDEKYQSYNCRADDIKISNERPLWYDYVLSGIKGALDEFSSLKSTKSTTNGHGESNGSSNGDNGVHQNHGAEFQGIKLAFSGTVPPAAGLSSSSALVSASLLSVAYFLKLDLNRQKLATLSAISERYVGTLSGGMDQAIAFLGQKGCASYIEFNPLTAQAVELPNEATFVIAHSLHEANKAANQNYNIRVIECQLASKIIAKHQNLSWKEIQTPKQLQDALKIDLPQMITLCDQILTKEIYSREDICELLEISQKSFLENLLTPKVRNLLFEFKLRQRALHVFNEAYRVTKFKEICSSKDDKSKNNLEKLGQLMKESHDSLKSLYECSHENLDRIVEIGKSLNVKSRLTGAGWGGCIVALCEKGHEKVYIEVLKQEYYLKFRKDQLLGKTIDELVFSTQPQNGAEIFVVD
ncbi:N-acetylgalactosamine kinase-like [Ctenocephalides felis]|uniref:N-acetylgalactosamine kinase-like n=1 Tax=Ctenocephalides felis TaxID=7515 RepID=UPI000E6E2C4F|nr:N-acetylgalactosamine kinase-like [Ctenocephalides felis]XP_026462157.1 N-acetylgalactosamine kinase-like [Ctenocephalides felis]